MMRPGAWWRRFALTASLGLLVLQLLIFVAELTFVILPRAFHALSVIATYHCEVLLFDRLHEYPPPSIKAAMHQ